tara:strand:+ start:211 stop:615 length:405 start_codon:yes stop_codon:yes gene_type:complete
MAHYALLDDNNVVVQVFPGVDEYTDGVDWEHHYGAIHQMTCKRTSYNTCGNHHRRGGTPYRKNFASVGFVYDEVRDAFIPPQPFTSFILNEDKCEWSPPVPKPELTEGQTGMYVWNEEAYQNDNTQGWDYIDYS